ncbi:hypothetical protein RM844_02110 [Streptomyces sp. DSM 44915]|uniref:Uncharacterized protein n=1 Tax=Streptomyces chisholmiae TaxID=3075540 RepID=A0ABU2JJB7_9ACTN|nr:hypothetical protein [Streptomyces sp. DSM 44915]MDT0265077.1 hypothetical protein [Streptomyces sp. DSM 44915]
MTDESTGPTQLEPYVEALRARLPAARFILLMRVFNAWQTGGGRLGAPQLPHQRTAEEPLGADLQNEMLILMRLTGTP